MVILYVFSFVLIIVHCHGFILDGLKTTRLPPGGGFMTSGHYSEILNRIKNEKQSRLQLEALVNQIQQEVIVTKKQVSSYDDAVTKMNATVRKQFLEKDNEATLLENKDGRLQIDYNLLQLTSVQMKQNSTKLGKHEQSIQQDLVSLKRNVHADSQSISASEIDTKTAIHYVIIASNKLDVLSQALNMTTQELSTFASQIHEKQERNQNITSSSITYLNRTSFDDMRNSLIQIAQGEQDYENKTSVFKDNQNVYEQILHTQSSTVALKACINTYAATHNGMIPFTQIKVSNGIANEDSVKNNGSFTCETTGLYLISVFVMTNTHSGNIQIEKNNVAIAAGFFSISAHYTSGTATALARLDKDDTISVTSPQIHVYGYYQSCLNIVQIS